MKSRAFITYPTLACGLWLLLSAWIRISDADASIQSLVQNSQSSQPFPAYHMSATLCTFPDPPTRDFGDVSEDRWAGWTFQVRNCGDSFLEWTITADVLWVRAAPNIGTTSSETDSVRVSIDTAGLSRDQVHRGHLTVSSNNSSTTGNMVVRVRSFPSGVSPENVNQDAMVNRQDLALVSSNFGPPPFSAPRSDITGDGRVDVLDLAAVGRVLQRR